MTDDMVQWAQYSPGVGEAPGVADLTQMATAPPGAPDPRGKKPRHRPNRGRKRRYIGPFLEEPPWDILDATGYPIPRDLQILGVVPYSWRSGPAWTRWRAEVFQMWGSNCHLCGHPGADSADHLVPLAVWGNQPYDARISRPAHGIAGCPTCRLKCNSSRGHRAFAMEINNYKPAIKL